MDKTEGPALSIAVPTFNRGNVLQPLLEAIQKQAGPEDELLVCDDGSADNTARLLGSFPKFQIRRQATNVGMVENWNTCLRATTREWICLIHDDDVLAEGGLSALRKACGAAGEPALIVPQFRPSEEGFKHERRSPGRLACLNCPTIPSGAVLHRDITSAIGLFDPRFKFSADLEYFARICARFPLLVITSPEIVRYQIHGGNYQFETWMKEDFFEQLEAVERAVVRHAGILDEEAEKLLRERLDNNVNYMFGLACRMKNRPLIRHLGRRLRERKTLSVRNRIKAHWGAWTGSELPLPRLPLPRGGR